MPTLDEIVRTEQDMLSLETRIAQAPPYTAVNDLEEVCRTPSRLRYSNPTVCHALENAGGEAFVIECSSLKTRALWVTTGNKDYRRDYMTYIHAKYGLDMDHLPKKYDVDHLYNRTRAEMYGLKYIRTALVGYAPNRSHGASYEKDITLNEANRRKNSLKQMDEISSMKFYGFLSPLRDDPRRQEVESYALFAASKLGLDYNEVVRGIEYLREKASTPWAR